MPIPDPLPDEVLVRVEASPLNPSDQGLLFAAADMRTATHSGTATHPVVTATIPPARLKALAGRIDQSMPVGNEGAGVVVAAGTSDAARALLDKTVAMIGGAMYSQYRSIKADQCLVLPEGTTAEEGASCFINPLTALGMVNIVRSEAHEHTLRDLGAAHVCNSSSPEFMQEVTAAMAATGATIAFDAIGGGPFVGEILTCMEAAANRNATTYSRYGSTTHKQVYVYGRLDGRPIDIDGNIGMAWGVGGWLLWPFLQKFGTAAAQGLRERVVRELKTTFASRYAGRLSLAEALTPQAIAAYARRDTREKYLIAPQKM